MWRLFSAFFLATVATCGIFEWAVGDEVPAAKSAGAVCRTNEAEPPTFTPEREATALEFVRQHHLELGTVLAQLKELKRGEYELAIRELFQTHEKLAGVKVADDEMYRLMLEAWQVDSQIKLLAARYAFAGKKDADMESELKTLLYRQVDLQRRHIERNRDRALASLETMNTNIKLLGDKRDELVERRLKNFIQVPAKQTGRTPPLPTASAGGKSPAAERSNP